MASLIVLKQVVANSNLVTKSVARPAIATTTSRFFSTDANNGVPDSDTTKKKTVTISSSLNFSLNILEPFFENDTLRATFGVKGVAKSKDGKFTSTTEVDYLEKLKKTEFKFKNEKIDMNLEDGVFKLTDLTEKEPGKTKIKKCEIKLD